jgi:S1-C subfamily serine protease
MTNESNPFVALSEAMATAVAKAGASTIQVNARRRLPGSGISYAPNLVLTADHILERDEDIQVGLPDGTQIPASVAGRDPGSDLAILRLSQGSLAVAHPAPQTGRVGQLVLALGRPTLNGIEASLGVISAIGGPVRTGRGGLLETYLRTDTISSPGFSGGPLIDADGYVVGINTSGLAHGIALTIPATLAWQTAETLDKHGHIRRGYLGIRSQPVDIASGQAQGLGRNQETGLLIISVEADSPAERGGLIVGDILVAIADHPLNDPDELLASLTGSIVGQATPVQVLRGGQPHTLQVTIGERK